MSQNKPALLLLVPDVRLRDIYASRFERAGWEVEVAANLTDAERRAVQLRPDVLLVYHAMLEDIKVAFKHLRSLPTLLDTRIVIADMHLSNTTIEDLLKAGASEVVLTAHLTPQALVNRMNQLIA